jgi:hypothetical protein
MAQTTFSGPVASTGGFIPGASSVVAHTAATLSATHELHNGRLVTVSRAAGSTITLPAATGTGAVYSFAVITAVTSNSLIVQVASASDVMVGAAAAVGLSTEADESAAFVTAADSDTITMNGTTTGGLVGTKIVLRDIASGTWLVECVSIGSGTLATPFSAAV